MCTPWPIGNSGKKLMRLGEVSGFCHGVVEVFALLGWYAALVGSHQHFGTACHSLFSGPKQSKNKLHLPVSVSYFISIF